MKLFGHRGRVAPVVAAEKEPANEGGAPVEIRLKDVHKSFGQNHVLRGIDLEIRRGEMVAIVGASGGGKTVLLWTMIGRMRPEEGHVFVADHESTGAALADLDSLNQDGMDRLRRHWALVFQKNALFTGTVCHNVSLALVDVKQISEPEARVIAANALKSVGLEPDQVLGLAREELSGGMAKRVAIARALALDPMLVFYDEPTTGLDPQHAEQIQDLIRQVHQRPPAGGSQRTTIVITHDAALLYRLKPRVVMLHEGKVFFDGPARAFESSVSPIIRPYLTLMPLLHQRVFLPGPSFDN